MADTTAPNPTDTARSRRREPIGVKWHHSTFEISLVSVQAVTAAVTMIVAIIGALYVHGEHDDRRQARMTRAWTLLHDTREERNHNVGQVEALQSLHADGANLREVSMEGRYLQGVALPGASLYAADFSGSRMMDVDLTGADLRFVQFERTKLKAARLDGADLAGADLGGADLAGASLRRANLAEVNLTRAYLAGADLRGARGLTGEMLATACAAPDDPPRVPEGLAPPPAC